MRRIAPKVGLAPVLILISAAPIGAADLEKDWPQWRGPDASGAVKPGNQVSPPVTWSETENIHWKVEIPGAGSSTPIVLNNRVYISTAVKTDRIKEGATPAADEADADAERSDARRQRNGDGDERRGRRGGFGSRGRGRGRSSAPANYYDFMVIAYDRADGKEVWRTTLTSQVPHEAGHDTNTFASASPLTDGERLYVSFGSRGIYCLDMEGNVVWEKNLGQMETRAEFGEGSSPAVHDGTLVVPWDHEGESFIVALDAQSGTEKWRVARDERTTWATPLITEYQGQTQVITNGTNRVRSYDLQSGELIWECGGQTENPIPSPVRFGDNVIVMSGFRGNAIYSIPLSAEGDVTEGDSVNWSVQEDAPYVPSPVLYRGQIYVVKSNSQTVFSRDAETGELVFGPKRLPDISSIYASPVAADENVYFTGRDGTTVVLRHGATFEVVSTNPLDDKIDASAAIVGDQIFLRGRSHLYCISEQ